MSILTECDMEKHCEAAATINTSCCFHNERHLIPYAALINRFHNRE